MRFLDSKNRRIPLYRNVPTHVLDRNIVLPPKQTMELDLYLMAYDLSEKNRFDGIGK